MDPCARAAGRAFAGHPQAANFAGSIRPRWRARVWSLWCIPPPHKLKADRLARAARTSALQAALNAHWLTTPSAGCSIAAASHGPAIAYYFLGPALACTLLRSPARRSPSRAVDCALVAASNHWPALVAQADPERPPATSRKKVDCTQRQSYLPTSCSPRGLLSLSTLTAPPPSLSVPDGHSHTFLLVPSRCVRDAHIGARELQSEARLQCTPSPKRIVCWRLASYGFQLLPIASVPVSNPLITLVCLPGCPACAAAGSSFPRPRKHFRIQQQPQKARELTTARSVL